MIIPAHLEELCLAPLPEVQLQYSRLWLVWKCLFFCSSSSSSTSPQVYINALVLVCIVTSQLPSTLHYLKKKQKTCFIVDLVKCPVRRRLFNVYGWSPQYQCFVSVRSKVVVVWNLSLHYRQVYMVWFLGVTTGCICTINFWERKRKKLLRDCYNNIHCNRKFHRSSQTLNKTIDG